MTTFAADDAPAPAKLTAAQTADHNVAAKSGQVTHLWINTESFLETNTEGQPRKLDGLEDPVEVYFRDYRAVSGLQSPFVLETTVLPVGTAGRMRQFLYASEKILIEKVQVNTKLEASHLPRPEIQTASIARQRN